MLADALFVSPNLIERAVTIAGQSYTFWFKELPAIEFIRFHSALSDGNEDAKAGAAATLIAASLCNADGTRAMTADKAMTLKTGALNALFGVVMEINGHSPGNG